MEITVEASPNFALTKYWGKSGERVPKTFAAIPATPSIGITVAGISSLCRINLGNPSEPDSIMVNGIRLPPDEKCAADVIVSTLRRITGFKESVHIDSFNSFPTAAGAASSSSGMAAIAFGLAHLLNVPGDILTVTELAQAGSVSAARATCGGFVHLPAEATEGAETIYSQNHWETLRIVLCITSREQKIVSSRNAMQLSQETSPIFSVWKNQASRHTEEILRAITTRDLELLGTISERNAFLMHATTMTSSPSVLFWNAGTLTVINTIQKLRKAGICAWCTIDAGPQVKVICESSDLNKVLEALRDTPLLLETIPLSVGGGPRITAPVCYRNHLITPS